MTSIYPKGVALGTLTMSTLTADLCFDQDLFSSLQETAAQLTRAFLCFCQTAYFAKASAKRHEWPKIKQAMGWTPEMANAYAKAGEWLVDIPPVNLELLDPKTILALCQEKYAYIIELLKNQKLTVEQVRQLMKSLNKANKTPKPPQKVMQWHRAKTGERSLMVRLDAEVGAEFEARYQEFAVPLPLFVRSLLQRESPDDVWQQAQQELGLYIDEQAKLVDEIVELQTKIAQCDRLISQFANSTNPSEIVVVRMAKEDKIKLQSQLENLNSLAA